MLEVTEVRLAILLTLPNTPFSQHCGEARLRDSG
jgi:hypothetical protein